MAVDVPADVEAVLTQLLTASHEAALTIATRPNADKRYREKDSISHTHYTASIEHGKSSMTDEVQTIQSAIETVETVSTNKLPAGLLQTRLQHGCKRVQAAIEPDPEPELDPGADATTDIQPLLAAAYIDAMLRRVEEEI
ncbi:MAG: hypothetical protein J07HQW1_02033 [Haloquadratum walsbyi J07HQW1]|jgi:hypothetical protein|uniref:DUF8101 domain-containing protein n=1 Tax=Haloquadratum walsbyi J07HQW1 TaxID=1238424 RepID=U1MPV0_9EURY|nr:MAG: hypothetical protein J07HQW1_02033 [Haloquadratum walsbyi J07HQW1]